MTMSAGGRRRRRLRDSGPSNSPGRIQKAARVKHTYKLLLHGNNPRECELQLISWLPFLDTYRTMCLAPQPDFRRVLEDVRAMQLAA